ncbi:bola protein [Kockiozyma suomiensis]|uniref:bola protein n=1 Tax=Kockiozyma suomiensis TaxID=1337062 RepID=UPI0033433CF0
MSSSTSTPYADRIKSVLEHEMEPVHLAIFNDSHKHAHHKPMAGNTNPETHFRLEIVSNYFEGKRLPMRHRAVYALFQKEMAEEGGIHAMQLKTLTPKEWEERKARE